MFVLPTAQKRLSALGMSYLVSGPNTRSASVPFADNFNRANASLEDSLVSSSGLSWVHDGLISDALTISSNAVACATTDSTGTFFSAGPQGSLNQFVQFTTPITTQPVGSFFVVRAADRNNFVGIRAGQSTAAGQIEVYTRIGGVLALKARSSAGAYTAGQTARLSVSGSTWTVTLDGVPLASNQAIGDGGVLTSQNSGIVARIATGVFGDNFSTGVL